MEETQIEKYHCLAEFRTPLFRRLIKDLQLLRGSTGLDAGCGIGTFTGLLAEAVGGTGTVVGVDISEDIVEQAEKNNRYKNVYFRKGDVTALQFKDNSFDWIWSVDTVWPGPSETGCPAENPLEIIHEFFRVLRSGGTVYLLFWTSQKLLSGYPILEARLNTTSSAQAPFTQGMNPLLHVMNAGSWLAKTGFSEITAHTHAGDIIAPLDENSVRALHYLFDMLWGKSQSEVSPRDWKQLLKISSPDSPGYVLNNPHYYGFYTYTMFTGLK